MLNPNRAVAIASVLISLLLALLPVLANFDWTSTAGVLAGVIAVLGVTQKWLEGWQKHEDRTLGQKVQLDVNTAPLAPDQGDAGSA